MKTQVHVIEVQRGDELLEKEKEATAALRRFFPNCGPVKLYRTADGKIGFEAKLALTLGDRSRLDEAYRAVMKALWPAAGQVVGGA